MKALTDLIVGTLFWVFMYFSAVEVFQFFQEAATKQILRGLTPTTKFTDALLSDSKRPREKQGSKIKQ